MKHAKHLRRYPVTVSEKLYSVLLVPVVVVVTIFVALKIFALDPSDNTTIPFADLFVATGYTLLRLFCAYGIALLCAIPLAMLATYNQLTEKIFIPIFDILESVPALAFFPILILLFIRVDFLNGAAIFILFLSMLWNIVFTVAGGLKIIPKDITYVAKVFGIKKWQYFTKIILPAIVPELVTGSILAMAQGWNLIIVAEVMHTYLPGGTHAQDLYGIGSILVEASARGQTPLFVASLGMMVLVIALINYFVWQKLIHYAERFKFE